MTWDATLRVGVVGAGAMGRGIAQVAAQAGHDVILGDAAANATERARGDLTSALDRLVEKGKIAASARDATLSHIHFVDAPLTDVDVYRECDLVIEAIVEDLAAKQAMFRQLSVAVSEESVLATNTSSLSVASIASAVRRPERVLGLHFFNPAPVLPLVEVVPWMGTDPALAPRMTQLMEQWRKTPVTASDTPGFIVNRIARPFYGESIRILEEGIADCATIDWTMRELGGFRMGPFELMDFIGNDVNYAVTRSVFEAFFYDPRYRPSLTQRRLVESGFLGRKSGRGYYEYGSTASVRAPTADRVFAERILDRVLAMLVNEAADAVLYRVASVKDIDLAMTKGVNYPKGLLSWGDELGLDRILATMKALHETYAEERYRPSPLLKRMVAEGRQFTR